MPAKQKPGAFSGAVSVIKDSAKVIRSHPEILVYPYAALLFISITFPIVSATIFAHWYRRIFAETGTIAPHKAGLIIGLVGFSAFYTALVTAYFTVAVSAGVLSKLEGRPTPPLYGLLRVAKNFLRVTKFAILSVFFFPVGVYAQRSKLPKGVVGVIGSSLTLHMAQAAPSILATNKKFGATIRDSIDTLGRAWREGLILKVGTYAAIFLIVALPKLIQHGFFKSHSASNVGWLISLELATSSYVTLKVINSIFTTVLYHKARAEHHSE
jgi:hypothetical protein